ncbi:hypothetical protein GN958_ATG16476 [Phytophthora infestans]|uniref:Uncharacterized protein n=1 Tax=Phytophthora infestans TaxID=4787 RepID=A0A8S9U647_PHYIN|nr:hypothetical protein GN958_ATG16476 [Phytophthora infestans]
MSELSDDDGADLFESDSDDQVSKVDTSLALPSLPLDDGELPKNTDCAGDRSVGEFNVRDALSPAKREEGHELDHEDNSARDDYGDIGQAELEPCQTNRLSDELSTEKDAGRSGDDQLPATVTHCESPKINDHQQVDADYKTFGHEKLDNEHDTAQIDRLDDDFTPSDNTKMATSLEITNTTQDASEHKAVHFKHDDSVPLIAVSEEIIEELNHTKTLLDEDANERRSLQQADTNPTYSTPITNAPKQSVYTVETLFPVVYESNTPSTPNEIEPISNDTIRRRRTDSNRDKTIASRFASLQARLEAAKSELVNATRTFKLKLSLVESDNKKLSERNTRLKTQLSLATANLQRSNAEMMKLKTENEIYATKLPKLQAELLLETSQVDETQAHSVQTQLVLSQLKARSHVLQTRNHSLETQNNKLTQQLREYQQHLKRKTAALQQQTEKAIRIETDMNELKTTYAHEKLAWKNRLTAALQRFEHDKNKLETQFETAERKEFREAKDRAEKAGKKRRMAEATTAKLEARLKQCNHELSSANDTAQRRTNEVRTLEALLRKAHRTEATLRNDLAVCKTRLRSLQDVKKRSMARSAIGETRRHRLRNQIPVEMLLQVTYSSDEEEQENQVNESCDHVHASIKDPPPSPCSECPLLEDELQQLKQELRRLRSLHLTELNAQASVLDALLQHTKDNR